MLLAVVGHRRREGQYPRSRNYKQLRPQRSQNSPLSGQPDHGGNRDKADQQDAGRYRADGRSAKHYPYSSFSVRTVLFHS